MARIKQTEQAGSGEGEAIAGPYVALLPYSTVPYTILMLHIYEG